MRFISLLVASAAASKVGPIQKVINLLEDLHDKVKAEGEVEQEQFEAYTDWAEKEIDTVKDEVTEGQERIEAATAAIESSSADVAAESAAIEEESTTLASLERELNEATQLRGEEKADYEAAHKDLSEAIDQIVSAVNVLKRAGLGLTQKKAAFKAALLTVTKSLAVVLDAASIDSADRHRLSALVQAAQSDDDDDDLSMVQQPQGKVVAYESHSKNIIETLQELKETAEGDLIKLEREETSKQHAYEMLRQNLEMQMKTHKGELAELKKLKASNEEILGKAQGDKSSAETKLADDQAYLSTLQAELETRTAEFKEKVDARREELDVIKKGLSLLKKDDFSAAAANQGKAFLEIATARSDHEDAVRDKLANFLQGVASKLNSVGLAQLAARTRAGADPFAKVRGMIEDMITRLMTQAAAEADHKQWCDAENLKSKDKRDKHEMGVDKLSTRVDKMTADVAMLKQQIAVLGDEIAKNVAGMAAAQKLRQEENATFQQLISDLTTMQDTIAATISVLQEYYSNKKEAMIQRGFQGPTGFAGSYQPKLDASTGIIGLLETVQADLAQQETAARATETQAASAYQKLKQESEVSAAAAEADKKGKETLVQTIQADLAETKQDLKSEHEELDATLQYIEKLKGSCEHKEMTFEERAAKREQEITSLQEALRILEEETVSGGQQAGLFMQKSNTLRGLRA